MQIVEVEVQFKQLESQFEHPSVDMLEYIPEIVEQLSKH